VSFRVDELTLLPGQYWVSASLYDESCTYAYDYHDHMYELNVGPGDDEERYGLVRLPGRWAHATIPSASAERSDGFGAHPLSSALPELEESSSVAAPSESGRREAPLERAPHNAASAASGEGTTRSHVGQHGV
jgi:hypothetical protein